MLLWVLSVGGCFECGFEVVLRELFEDCFENV